MKPISKNMSIQDAIQMLVDNQQEMSATINAENRAVADALGTYKILFMQVFRALVTVSDAEPQSLVDVIKECRDTGESSEMASHIYNQLIEDVTANFIDAGKQSEAKIPHLKIVHRNDTPET